MKEKLFEELKRYYSYVADDAVDYYLDVNHDLVVKTSDGNTYLFDCIEKGLRRLPREDADITEDDFGKEFGRRLNARMIRKCVTQTALSKMTGIHQTLISQYVSGKVIPSFYRVHVLAKALDCSVDDLCHGTKRSLP